MLKMAADRTQGDVECAIQAIALVPAKRNSDAHVVWGEAEFRKHRSAEENCKTYISNSYGTQTPCGHTLT